MQSRSVFLILIVYTSLSITAIAIISIYHEASAKECNNNNHGSRCSDKQGSDSNDDDHVNKHSNSDDDGGNSAKKEKTPFVLPEPVPFP